MYIICVYCIEHVILLTEQLFIMNHSAYSDTSSLVEIARLYYLHQFSQQQIAERLGISRPNVSRRLQQARENGIVRIEIQDPSSYGTQIEQTLADTYGLKKAIVVPSYPNDPVKQKQALGIAAAHCLNKILKNGMILGVAWGTTLQETVKHLIPEKLKNMTTVQLIGGVARTDYDTHASEIVQTVGTNYRATPYLLPLPTIVENIQVKQAMMSDSHIQHVINLATRADVAIYSTGIFSRNAVLAKAELLSSRDVEMLEERRAIGDLCARFLTRDGKIAWPELDARTIGIDLSCLKIKPHAIAVAGGEEKQSIIRAVLLGGYCNTLITDTDVAQALIEDHLYE